MSIFTRDNIPQDEFTKIGEWSYGAPSVSRAYSGCKLEIGKFCSFGAGIQIAFWGKHQMQDISTYPFNILQGWPPVTGTLVEGENIFIGNDVWIGHNALIMQGAYIEDGAVVGAHSIVGGHVNPYALVVGNPAKEVRKRFPEDQIQKLVEMTWWNWPIEKVRQHLQIISSPNVELLHQIWLTEIKK